MTWFFDSSAIVKLIVNETESAVLRKFKPGLRVASRISRIEVLRNIYRIDPKKVEKVKEKLNGFNFIEMGEPVFRNAEEIAITLELKSLDAIQAGSALFVKDSIEGVISYDKNLNQALAKLGILVLSPGISK